jgi:hypothetical protein
LIRIKSLVLAVVCLVAAGCGGGSSAGTGTPPVNPAPPVQIAGAPTITAVTPSSATTGGGPLTITVAGTGFVSGSVVEWNKAALPTTFASSTSLSAVLPASDLQSGSVNAITVTNPGSDGTSSSLSFNVNNPLPVIASVTPASVFAGSAATSLNVTGSDFVKGSLVNWNGSALVTQFVSGTALTAVLPASDVTGSAVAMVTVTSPTPGGGTTSPSTFTVNSPRPTIGSISPQTVVTGVAATITVTGSGFESNSILLWNGSARPTTFVNSTTLQVALSAADLQQSRVGSLTVSNPGPDASTSAAASLAVVSQLIPTITAVSITATNYFGGCPQLQVTVTGTNFAGDSIIMANGMPLAQNIQYQGDLSSIINFLPAGFVSKPGALSFTVTNPGQPAAVSAPFAYPATSPTVLGICAVPSPATVFPSSAFTVTVQPTEVNATGNEQVSVGTLPAGLSVSNAAIPLPAAGALLHFQAAASLPVGMDNVTLTGTAGTVTAAATLALTVTTAAPAFGLSQPSPGEVAVPIGGSGSTMVATNANEQNEDFDITPSVTGLPAGTTATFSPASVSPGQSFTVTLHAASNAPVTQNQTVTLVATPSAMGAPISANFFVDVTQPPGSLPDSRADFTSTDATPYAATYDDAHHQIFASNPAWNRVDVLSSQTHQVIKRIAIPSPQGIDISQDGSTVWVGTLSQQVYAINTNNLSMTRYLLPQYQSATWTDYALVALSDGTLLLTLGPGAFTGNGYYALWNPSTNALSTPSLNLNVGLGAGPVSRSGDGTKLYTVYEDSSQCTLTIYDVATQTATTNTSSPVCGFYAANHDGSRLVAENNAVVSLYDGSMNLIGAIPLDEPSSPYYFSGSFVFSKDGSALYELANGRIATIDVSSLQITGTAPGSSTQPGILFGSDDSGQLFDLPISGVGFEDAAFVQNFGVNITTPPTPISISPYSGPLSGNTQFSPYGGFQLTPDVWFNGVRGTAQVNGPTLTLTSPPASTPGPVNVKYIYPDGNQLISPLVFSYSVFPQYAITSGASPSGGVPATISGWGMPLDSSGGSVTVGGNAATITSQTTQYPPFTGQAFPTTFLNFTVPNGAPGPADIVVTTPAGTGTLHKALLYAQSVADYPSADTLTSVLYDAGRNQVYLTASDHVDVFSLSSNQFVTPLAAPASGKIKQLTGLALTPAGNQLLVTDLQDGSLAVVDPDTPANSFVIPIAPENSPGNNCSVGPLYVAASADQKAFVMTGSLPAPSCPAQGQLYVADLQARSASQPSAASTGCGLGPQTYGVSAAESTSDGSVVLISSGCLYSATTGLYQRVPLGGFSNQISGDGNVLAGSGYLGAESGSDFFTDLLGNRLQSLAQPLPLYPSPSSLSVINPLYQPVLNASGSLQYIAYPNYFEIIDVLHGRLLVRFSLAETVQNTAAPIAVDAAGRYVFLITTTGLTVVDLGEAPLAIGHLSSTSGTPGTQITVRGSGFDSSLAATVGGQAANVTIVDANTLQLTIPSVTLGPEDLVLSRSDGSTYTLDSGVTIQ